MDDFLVKLNEEISTKLFKNVVLIDEHSGQKVVRLRDKQPIKMPNYSTDIDMAYNIIKKIRSKDYEVLIGFNIENNQRTWFITITKNRKTIIEKLTDESLPKLICLVALKLLEVEKEFDAIPQASENVLAIDFSKKT